MKNKRKTFRNNIRSGVFTYQSKISCFSKLVQSLLALEWITWTYLILCKLLWIDGQIQQNQKRVYLDYQGAERTVVVVIVAIVTGWLDGKTKLLQKSGSTEGSAGLQVLFIGVGITGAIE